VRKREVAGVGLLALGCILVVFLAMRGRAEPVTPTDVKPLGSSSVVAAPDKNEVEVIQARELWRVFQYDGAKAHGYRDKPIRVTGRIESIYPLRRMVTLDAGEIDRSIQCFFTAVESMENLQEGKYVTLEGICRGNTERDVTIENVVVVGEP
jgi:hypothetical protein